MTLCVQNLQSFKKTSALASSEAWCEKIQTGGSLSLWDDKESKHNVGVYFTVIYVRIIGRNESHSL